MDIAALSIRNRTTTLVLTATLLIAGYLAYNGMSRLEDPEFTIKEALIITPYPGASAYEVEEQVSDAIETSIQEMGQLKQVRSKSTRGLSIVTAEIQDQFGSEELPQVWDELRRKVNDIQGELPNGVQNSVIVDDYGDVYGVFFVITGDGYSYAELKDYVDLLRRELLLVDDVGKIDTFGEREEAIYIEFSRSQLAQLQLSVADILTELDQRNTVVDAGRVYLGDEYLAFDPSGELDSVQTIGSLLVRGSTGEQFFLRDIAAVSRGYTSPQDDMIRFDGNPGIGLGIATLSGGNVVTMGDALNQRLAELEADRPVGIEIGTVSRQSDTVTAAINGFLVSLVEAVAIVVFVLFLFMGLRSALIIGFVLVLTIAGSFVFLDPMGVALERISLGALIIALGMLVDNAIVVIDGMLVRMQRGKDAEDAASEIVSQSMWPLLGATIIAILAFAAIGTSDDATGEFCRSLFQVVMVSLLLSWVTAITVTPLLGVLFLDQEVGAGQQEDPYGGRLYRLYRSLLSWCLDHRLTSIGMVLVIFVGSLLAFTRVDQSFFPASSRPQFMVDVWLPQGTAIEETERLIAELEQHALTQPGVTHVTSVIGQGALRFLLTYSPEKSNRAYGQMLVDVTSEADLATAIAGFRQIAATQYPTTQIDPYRFEVGPGGKGKVEARFSGPDAAKLRRLAEQTATIFRSDYDSRAVRTNWRQRVKTIQPVILETQANQNGITRQMVAETLTQAFDGQRVGTYREADLLLPIKVRAELAERVDIASLENLQIWSPVARESVPLRQVIAGFDVSFEDEIIERRDRKRSISIYADPTNGFATDMLTRVQPAVEALAAESGYELEWGGEYEDTANAQGGLAGSIPSFIAMMVLITVVLFNSLRIPLVIWLIVPMAVVGVALGLLSTGQSFGFMSLLGFLSLMGMLIKNAIVLVDEINLNLSTGLGLRESIVESGVSRLRPVAMAAFTTALGMIPLVFDSFFVSMAVTIIGGLTFATILTMIYVPVFYESFCSSGSRAT
ncbi:MAG: efflux RND transporter permease subunit [Pseudomonadota bacterium]